MYLAGPLSNLIVAVLIKYININEEEKIKILYTNLSLCIFNLLPIIPLDGGNILREILKNKFNNINSNKVTLIISKVNLILLTFVYSILILKIKNITIFFLIMYLWYLNFIEDKKLEIVEKTYKIVNENLTKKENKNNEKILQ